MSSGSESRSDAPSLLETRGLVKEFGGLVATDDVSIDVKRGERVSVIGPNGAGKSTLINLITRRLDPTAGDIVFKGDSIVNLKPHQVVQRGISKSFQTASIFPDLTVMENAEIAALAAENGEFGFNFLTHRDKLTSVHELAENTLESVGLLSRAGTTAADLPYGDKRRLEIGIALAAEPDLLLMDEPTAGMSPEETQATVDLIEEVKEELGLTFVLVEHDMEIVFSVSDRIVVLNRGRVIAEGTPDEIRGNPDVQEAYLGGVEL
ncbi:branched-chain amino acid ABC transporter ATP-binding protein [Halogeometricum pallidum JCM 14848]|uniref:Probable branched-chain amino acid transport ATP-binding protein LivG n=1 Tax=Halogeometricum pallidum JCM 14848 TaxID=1227487 RepID=M0CTS5_HALPD|nr:ABC transporter ATP-binding protein [Halogeometricum pallidum]ELZ26655.1 branched-chain amino acid ABC transporter ATP-binding protein [Halogeometricum pallidum JCM 14848]